MGSSSMRGDACVCGHAADPRGVLAHARSQAQVAPAQPPKLEEPVVTKKPEDAPQQASSAERSQPCRAREAGTQHRSRQAGRQPGRWTPHSYRERGVCVRWRLVAVLRLQDLLVNVAPKKANWDLKRDVQPKLDKLERRTQRAIVQLMMEQVRSRVGWGTHATRRQAGSAARLLARPPS